jgi:hypothetical protein
MAKGTQSNSSSGQRRITQLKEEQALLQEGSVAWKKIDATIEQIEKRLTNSVENIEEFSDSVKSLGAGLGKNNKLFESMSLLSASMQGSMKSVGLFVKELGPDASKFKKETFKTADAYKSLGNVIAVNSKKLKKQQITTSQYNQSVLDSYDDLEEAIERLESQMEGLTGKSLQSAQAIKRTFENQQASLEAAAKAAEKSKQSIEGIGFVTNKLSSTGIPAIEEFGDVIMKAKEGGQGLTLAMAALGFAAGKAAYDLGLVGDKIGTIAKYDQEIGDLTTQIDVFNDKLRLGMVGGGKNFVAAKAINDFSNQVANMAMEFQAASKTALFGKGLGGVGYGAAQLQMAGISAETIATSMKDASSAMGSNVSGKFGADMAILAARTGQTSEGIASINDTFMRLGGVSKETAISMQEGLRAMASQANINLGALMEDVAEASKDALSYQLKSPQALAKAATFAQSLGTKFTEIANAGKSMVLNYKDSIKAEMSLSAMLGRRVDLSQVRALFAAGKTEEAVRALKAQGLDPSKMNMFQQEQLKSATGGLDLNSLQKIATRTGRSGGELGKGDVGAENQVFLSTKSSAESAKAIGAAVQAAMTEIQNKELDNQYNKAKNQALILNTDGIADLTAQLKQKEAEKSIMSSGFGYGLAGAGIMTLLTKGKGLGKLFGKGGMGKFFGKGGSTPPISATGPGNQFSGYKMVGKHGNVHDASGKFVSRANADAFKQSQGYVKAKSGVMYKPGTPQANAIMAAGKNTIAPAASMTAGAPGMSSTLANTAKTGLGSKVTSNLLSSVKGVSGVLSVLTAAYDYKTRKDAGQTTLQAGAGTIGGTGGALAGAALGSAIFPVVGTIIGGAIGYWAGSSLADELTGANEPQVEAQEELAGTYEMTNAELEAEIANGNLLNSSEYAVELQQKMLEIMGLQAEFLNDIAESNRTVTSVNLDGSKVLNLLNSRTARNYGVTRLTSINRNVK